ncbi:MAG: YqaA family protein [Planctomycetota bacterium]
MPKSTDTPPPEGDAPRRVARWHLHRRLYDWVLHWAHTPYGTPALILLSFCESSFFPVPPDPLLMALALARRRRAFYYALVCSAASVLGGLLGYLIGYALWNPVGAPILRSPAAMEPLNASHEVVVVEKVEPPWVTVRHAEGELDRLHRSRLHVDPPNPDAEPGRRVGDIEYEREQTAAPLRPGQTAYFMTDKYHKARSWYERYGEWIVFLAAFTPIPYKVFTILSGLAQLDLLKFTLASVVGRSTRFFLVGTLIYVFGRPIRRFIDKYFNLLTFVFVLLLVGGFLIFKVVH